MATYILTPSQLYGQGILNSFSIPSGTSFDPDYQAILDKATSLSYTLPSVSVQVKQNTLLTSLKTIGVWNKLDIFYAFAQDGGANFGTLNWKNPNANQCTLISSPTFVSNGGFQGDGVGSYLDTNFNPATQGVQYTLNNASRYFFAHAISGTGRFDGNSTAGVNSIIRNSTTFQRINNGNSNLATAFDFNTTANAKSIHRTSSTSVTLYNGTTGSSNTMNSSAILSANQFILASGTGYAAHTCAAYAMGASMVTENTDFVNTWDTYKSSL